ncbi:hypothetical protein HD806DRAFT_162473 [Xylariaceae sp. AK1471]|nr:hypothetical protein HD806DRAFT_162473 [Xylariaceae sp. AK1471]
MEQQKVSMVFNMLPTSVQCRIPPFKSLRRSVSLSILPSRRQSARDGVEEFTAAHRDDSQVVTSAEAQMRAATQPRREIMTASGVRWRYAKQGTNMHRIADLEKEDPAFTRKSYIDGVAYMLMALPDNLNDQEVAVIREALPPSIADASLVDGRNGRTIGWKPSPEGRTVLQRCVANLVALLVVLMHLVLSCATVVVRVGAQYERKHNISQQMVSRGFVIATAVGRHSVVLSAKIYAMSDGRVGKAVSNIATWTAESVSCGIQDGIRQGLMMTDMRLRPV